MGTGVVGREMDDWHPSAEGCSQIAGRTVGGGGQAPLRTCTPPGGGTVGVVDGAEVPSESARAVKSVAAARTWGSGASSPSGGAFGTVGSQRTAAADASWPHAEGGNSHRAAFASWLGWVETGSGTRPCGCCTCLLPLPLPLPCGSCWGGAGSPSSPARGRGGSSSHSFSCWLQLGLEHVPPSCPPDA